jgi:RNA polymerase sigma factor (sigma-70 family)
VVSCIDSRTSTELVFDHLRRLPDNGHTERSVVKFDPARPRDQCVRGSSAEAYLHRLTHDRAIDVARARRRHSRRFVPFSYLNAAGAVEVAERPEATDEELDGPESCREATQRLHEAVGQLPPRQRAVIELLREGKSQVVIAHALGVCEGTVSRLRVKAIAKLRRMLAE